MNKKELQLFIDLANAQRNLYKGCPSDIGLSIDKCVAAGVSLDTLIWLRIHHYISVKQDQPIWIAFIKNKYHPKATLENLQKNLNKNNK